MAAISETRYGRKNFSCLTNSKGKYMCNRVPDGTNPNFTAQVGVSAESEKISRLLNVLAHSFSMFLFRTIDGDDGSPMMLPAAGAAYAPPATYSALVTAAPGPGLLYPDVYTTCGKNPVDPGLDIISSKIVAPGTIGSITLTEWSSILTAMYPPLGPVAVDTLKDGSNLAVTLLNAYANYNQALPNEVTIVSDGVLGIPSMGISPAPFNNFATMMGIGNADEVVIINKALDIFKNELKIVLLERIIGQRDIAGDTMVQRLIGKTRPIYIASIVGLPKLFGGRNKKSRRKKRKLRKGRKSRR